MSDAKASPGESKVRDLVGDPYSRFVAFAHRVDSDLGPLTLIWKYYKPTGWFKNGMIKKRRVFLFIPRESGFTFRMVFNEEAIAIVRDEDFPDVVNQGLDEAKKYPEGKPFDLDEASFDLDLAARLVDVKLRSTK